MTKLLTAAVAALAVVLAGCAGSAGAGGPYKVIYHINEGNDQASNGLRNANNQLTVDPTAKIVFVTHSKGVNFLQKGAKDKNGNKYEDIVERLKLKGVQFQVCEITLKRSKRTKDQFIEYASFVPSGVGQVTKLQQEEGYAYLKP